MKKKKRKWLIPIIVIAVIFLGLIIYSETLFSTLSSDKISMINVTGQPSYFDEVVITEQDEIENIVTYFKNLNTSINPKSLFGSGGFAFIIKIVHKNNTTKTIHLYGTRYIKVNGGPYVRVPYDEGAYFSTVLGQIMLDQYREKNGGNMISGEVLSIVSANSGHNEKIELKKDSGEVIVIDVSKSRIFDVTGGGWLVLHKGDRLEIGLKNESGYVADKVFVVESSFR